MKKIIDMPDDWEKRVGEMLDFQIADFLYGIIRNGTLIPDNATNGDVIKIIFPQDKLIDDIKVGDEVIVQVDKVGVVTGFDVLYDRVYVTTKDGWSDAFGRSFVKKTGRHFDEIENVLRQMRGESK